MPGAGAGRDPETIERYRRLVELFAAYYRPEIRGFEHLPDRGPFLVVGNHSGGGMPPDLPILMSEWWRRRGVEEPVYALFHSFFLNLPGVKETLVKWGALEAGWEEAEQLLRAGAIVVVYPGGDHEAFRPWTERNRIEFAGRTGFVKLAAKTGVPIVTATSIGIQDSIVVLSRGERIARRLPHLKRWRLKVMPVMLGPPWGISLGIPTLPLPTKATVQLGEPIRLPRRGAKAARDERYVRRWYDRITSGMQRTLDELAAERAAGG